MNMRKVTYPRTMKSELVKLVDFEYISMTLPESKEKLREGIVHQYSPFMDSRGIDKLSFRYHRDWLKENKVIDEKGNIKRIGDCYRQSYLYKAVEIIIGKSYFWINLNGEFIPLDRPLNEYVEQVFRYLILCTSLFKIPLRKESTDLITGEVKSKIYPENQSISTAEEYFHVIYDKRELTCIELCFDFHAEMRQYLPNEFSKIIGDSTLYTNDYRKYKNGWEHRSMLTLYDKRVQQNTKRHRHIHVSWERFEIRLFPYTFSCLKGESGRKLLDNTYDELIEVLSTPIKSHIKRYKLDFSDFVNQLPKGYEILEELLCF